MNKVSEAIDLINGLHVLEKENICSVEESLGAIGVFLTKDKKTKLEEMIKNYNKFNKSDLKTRAKMLGMNLILKREEE